MEVTIPVHLVFAVLCALVAGARGRNAFGWAILGFFLSCFALIALVVLPDLNEERDRQSRLARENRYLRERIAKERRVADQRHAETARRLDTHDHALGIDSRPARAAFGAPLRPELLASRGDGYETPWFFVEDAEQRGPVAFDELRDLWQRGSIRGETYVWCDGMGDWVRVRDVPQLEDRLRA